jgi:hypothetical protein
LGVTTTYDTSLGNNRASISKITRNTAIDVFWSSNDRQVTEASNIFLCGAEWKWLHKKKKPIIIIGFQISFQLLLNGSTMIRLTTNRLAFDILEGKSILSFDPI